MDVILLSGYKGAGKSTVAAALGAALPRQRKPIPESFQDHPSPEYRRRLRAGLWAFATPIKMAVRGMIASVMPRVDEATLDRYIYGDLKEEVIPAYNASSRRLQQLVGTELGREHLHETLWVDATVARLDDLRDDDYADSFLFIDDMRFVDEDNTMRQWALRQGNRVRLHHIHVHRPDLVPLDPHRSEQDVPKLALTANVTLVNDGSIDQLADRALDVARTIIMG